MRRAVPFTQHRASCVARTLRICPLASSVLLLSAALAQAQFIDNFDGPSVQLDPEGLNGWLFRPGDGTANLCGCHHR